MLAERISRMHDELIADLQSGCQPGRAYLEALVDVMEAWHGEAAAMEHDLARLEGRQVPPARAGHTAKDASALKLAVDNSRGSEGS